MKKPDIVVDIENEKEWRRFLVGEIAELRKEVNKSNSMLEGLKIKVAAVATIVSGIVGIVLKKIGI